MHPHPLPQPLGRECRVLSLGFPACLLVSANLILDACILHLLPLPVQRKIWSVSLAFTGALAKYASGGEFMGVRQVAIFQTETGDHTRTAQHGSQLWA